MPRITKATHRKVKLGTDWKLAQNTVAKLAFVRAIKDAEEPPPALNNGCYAYVYAHPTCPDRVIKVARNSPGYLKYIRWCMRHPTNPYVPRVYSLDIIHNADVSYHKDWLAVTLERLNPSMTENATPEMYDRERREFRALELTMRRRDLEGLAKPQNLQELRRVRDRFPRGEYLDIHPQNVMRRPRDGHLVITDPIAG